MYIYNYFIILLGVCVSYDTRIDMIHDIEKSKIDSRYNSRFDNYTEHTLKREFTLKLSFIREMIRFFFFFFFILIFLKIRIYITSTPCLLIFIFVSRY